MWCHWLWFFVPHGTVAYLIARRRDRFAGGAAQIYAVFDLGLVGYWAVPTAPPWYAAEQGVLGPRQPSVRRLMREHGQAVWKGAWGRSTMSWEAILSPPCLPCTSPHP